MAVEARPELVGKRFLCVSGDAPPEIGDIGRWSWRSGVIRAVNHRDNDNSDLTVYVEFDDQEWEKREWVKVYEDFQLFLLEHQLVWAKRKDSRTGPGSGVAAGGLLQGTKAKHIQWPALHTLFSLTSVIHGLHQLCFPGARSAHSRLAHITLSARAHRGYSTSTTAQMFFYSNTEVIDGISGFVWHISLLHLTHLSLLLVYLSGAVSSLALASILQ